MKSVLRYCAVLVLVLTNVPAQALEPFPKLYDDFNAANGLISPARWRGFEFGGISTETSREVENAELRMFHRAYGGVGSNSGKFFAGAGLVMNKNPGPIIGIEAEVQVSAFQAQDCTANSSGTNSFAGLLANFFNADTPGTYKDDMYGVIGITRTATDPAGELKVLAYIFRCTDDPCVNFTILNDQILDLGTTAVGQTETLRMKWDSTNDQIIFQRNADQETAVSYTGVSDSAQPVQFFKQLRVQNNVESCEPPAKQKKASIEAFFDNVRVQR
jgi:hypothetical protein